MTLASRLNALEAELDAALRLRDWSRAHILREEAQAVRERIYEALRPNSVREEACVVRMPEDVRKRLGERFFAGVDRSSEKTRKKEAAP